jgi:hypothetical protein
VLDVLRSGIDSALMGLGKASIHDLTPDDILVPPGFTRALGAEPGPGTDRCGSGAGALVEALQGHCQVGD